MNFNESKIGVIGGSQGLGSWVVRFFKELGHTIYFTSTDKESQFRNNRELVANCDIIFLSVPISAMTQVLEDIFPVLDQKIVIEVCSVKKFLIDKYEQLTAVHQNIQCQFYSIHPMFAQTVSELEGQVIIFTYSSHPLSVFERWLKDIFLAQKAVLYDIEYKNHDKLMGVVQGLNHFNVFVSAKTLSNFDYSLDEVKRLSSPPYRIFIVFFTRYVLQNPRLYADIQMYNEYILEVLTIFKHEVDMLYNLIANKNKQEFVNYVEEMQHYFAGNKHDQQLSNHLVRELGMFAFQEQLQAQE